MEESDKRSTFVAEMKSEHAIFNRTERLVGSDGMKAISAAKVIIFGIGGVGSWVAEGLVRSGVVHLTLVDSDVVEESNINRQLPALHSTVGRSKCSVLKERLLDSDLTSIIARGKKGGVGVTAVIVNAILREIARENG